MARQRYDIGSKWLLHNQGRGVLLVGGLQGVHRCEPMPGEIVQSRKYPDGLMRVFMGKELKPYHVLVEIATYSEKRALKQALDDLTLAYSALGHLPELVMLVLRPKGKFRITGTHTIHSKLGLSQLEVKWKLTELWTQPAERFLAASDVGATPWATLMQFDGSPESFLGRCAEKIQREAHPRDQADLLAVAQVLTELRFPDPALLAFFGGPKPMIESPLLQKMIAESTQQNILDILKARFDEVPTDVTKLLRAELKEKKLRKLVVVAAKCTDLAAFRDALLS